MWCSGSKLSVVDQWHVVASCVGSRAPRASPRPAVSCGVRPGSTSGCASCARGAASCISAHRHTVRHGPEGDARAVQGRGEQDAAPAEASGRQVQPRGPSAQRGNAAHDASIAPTITSSRSFRYTDVLYEQHPDARALRPDGNAALVNTNTFEQFAFLYDADRPQDGQEYVRVLGLVKNRRLSHWRDCRMDR